MYYSFICTTETSADSEGSVSAKPVNSNSVSSRLFFKLRLFFGDLILVQSPLTSLRTYEVTHSRFFTRFITLKIHKIKILIFLLFHKLGLLYIFKC